jgi:hypothetical protein
MDDVTQQNAALVEQAAAAESVQEQAQNLTQAVPVFNVGGTSAQAAASHTGVTAGNEAGAAQQAAERTESHVRRGAPAGETVEGCGCGEIG